MPATWIDDDQPCDFDEQDCWCEPVVYWRGWDVDGDVAVVTLCRRGIWRFGPPPKSVLDEAVRQAREQ